MLQPDDWRCPICVDLLFKPAVNSACGHVLCFWCLHKAMSPYAPSACPVCRTKYGHLPAICATLHRFLSCQFPEAYDQRREETEAEERDHNTALPDPPAGPLSPPAAPGQWLPQHFACDHPACGKLLCRPVVLNCGHSVCQPTCLPSPSASGGGSSGGYECPACGMPAHHAPAVCKQLGDLLEELFPELTKQRQQECAAAAAVAAAAAAAAAQQQAAAAAQQQAAVAAAGADGPFGSALSGALPTRGAPAVSAAAAALARAQQQQQQQQQQQREGEGGGGAEPTAAWDSAANNAGAVPSTAAAAGGGAATPPRTAGQQRQQQQPDSLSPSLVSALRRQAAGAPGQVLSERIEANLRRLAGESYTHHGVGCDRCGLYPIKGRRYRCEDCPDSMGFDLCGECMDRGLGDVVGRFNQRHTPDHRMLLVRPRMTAMHILQAANPELPMEQLMWLLELSLTRGEEEEVEEDEQEEGAGQQQHHHQQGQQPHSAADSSAGGIAAMPGGSVNGGGGSSTSAAAGGGSAALPAVVMLRRGPRPAFDPSAQEPSPSAYVTPSHQPQPQTQHHQHQHQHEQAGTAGMSPEAEGLIDDEMEGGAGPDGSSVTTVHVPMERLLRQHPPTGS